VGNIGLTERDTDPNGRTKNFGGLIFSVVLTRTGAVSGRSFASQEQVLIDVFLHVQMCSSAAFLYQRQDRINDWSRHTGKPSDLLHGGDQCIDLQASAPLQILQH
jgi:hypothetical protein